MKFKCKRESLYKGFQIINSVISSIKTKPVLQNVKIEAKGDILELFATDLEVGIRYFIQDKELIEHGMIAIPETKVENILREWVDESVEINTENNICNIYGADSSFVINGEADPEQFPAVPEFLEDKYLEIDPLLICQMIKRTVFIVTGERIRYTLSGIQFRVEGNSMEMVTTDGRRLSRVKKTIDNPSGVSYNCILPVKGLTLLERVISQQKTDRQTDKMLKIKVEENRALFKTKNFILSSQLIDGQYPDCNQIIPKEYDKVIMINTTRLLSAVKRASVVTDENSRLVRFLFKDNKLTLTAEASEIGKSTVIVDNIGYNKETFEIGFNPIFIIETLNVIGKDTIELRFTQPRRPGMLYECFSEQKQSAHLGQVDSVNEDGFIYVVMPISLEEEIE